MIHANSDSDVTSLAPSSPRSPKRLAYYVQSPSSRGSHDCDKSLQAATQTYNSSPTDSPRHSSNLASWAASRISGTFRPLKVLRKQQHSEKRWTQCNVIDEEEGEYDRYEEDIRRTTQCLIGLLGLVSLSTVLCLVLWGCSRPYRPRVAVKSLTVNNFYLGQGSDYTGVPTRLLSVNCSVKMVMYNPASYFGIHVSSTPLNLFYSEIAIATGQLKKYYQPSKSQRIVHVNLEGNNVPLYGAGASLADSDSSGGVPLRLQFDIHSRGDLVGKLVKTKHQRHISCSLVVCSSGNTRAIKLEEDSCTYD